MTKNADTKAWVLNVYGGRRYSTNEDPDAEPPPTEFQMATWHAERTPLRLIYPQADGTPNSWARHHWAYYDGTNPIEYTIAVGVGEGARGLGYELISGPPGMAVNLLTGIVTWTPSGPETDAAVLVRVYDQAHGRSDDSYIDVPWTVSTSSSTDHFIFFDVNNGSDTTGDGTYGNPFQTIEHAMGSDVSQTTFPGRKCYLFNGTYTVPDHSSTAAPLCRMDGDLRPVVYMGVPGHRPALDLNEAYMSTLNGDGRDMFFNNIDITGSPGGTAPIWIENYLIGLFGTNAATARVTLFDVKFRNIVDEAGGTNDDDNSACIHTRDEGTNFREFLFLSDVEYDDVAISPGIFYDLRNSLVQRGTVLNSTIDGGNSGYGYRCKDQCQNITFDGVEMWDNVHIHFCFSHSENGTSTNIQHWFCKVTEGTASGIALDPAPAAATNQCDFVRCTIKGRSRILDPLADPVVFENCVIVADGDMFGDAVEGVDYTIVGSQCLGTSSDNIIDADGNLTGTYRTNYLGAYGAEKS